MFLATKWYSIVKFFQKRKTICRWSTKWQNDFKFFQKRKFFCIYFTEKGTLQTQKWDHLFYSKRFCALLPFLFLEFAKNLYCCFLLLGHYCTHSNFASVRGLCFIFKLKRHCWYPFFTSLLISCVFTFSSYKDVSQQKIPLMIQYVVFLL